MKPPCHSASLLKFAGYLACLSLAFLLSSHRLNGAPECKPDTTPGSSAMSFAGFGADTAGGKGGRVIKVTTLNADGEGSLQAALAADGPRIIVFEVGGIIDWKMAEIIVTHGNLTLAGETAPTPGITIIRGSLSIQAPDVIVRHLRVRLGDGGDLKKQKWEGDCMGAVGPNVRNVLFDHCSTAWSVDENLSVSGPRVKGGTASFVTIRNCIVAEALDNSVHTKGPHSKGTLIHDFVHHVALAGNLYAHNFNRNPFLKPNTAVFMANNLVYDAVNGAMHFAWPVDEYKVIPDPMIAGELTAIGNVFRHGASTRTTLAMFSCAPSAPMASGKLYQKDSLMYGLNDKLLWADEKGDKAMLLSPQVTLTDTPMLSPIGFCPLPASMTEDYVLKNAGARPKERDAIDQRIVDNYRARKGRVIDSQDEVGGYPTANPTRRTLQVPSTPDAVEAWLETYRTQVEYR